MMRTLTKLIAKKMWTSKFLIWIMRTLTKLTVKNVDFKAFDMDHEDFEKINSKNVDLKAFDMDLSTLTKLIR